MSRGFTLVEMLVIIAIMMTVMAMLLPGIATMQKRTDRYATANVIQLVHATQIRNARQFGSAGLVYGYTIIGTGTWGSQLGIQPWVILPGGSPATPTSLTAEDVGGQLLWSGSYIEFTDNIWPKSATAFSVSFEPRTGLAYTGPAPENLTKVTDPTEVPNGGVFDLCSRRSPYPTKFEMRISPTGVMDVHGK